jgi:hypothetical protein
LRSIASPNPQQGEGTETRWRGQSRRGVFGQVLQ